MGDLKRKEIEGEIRETRIERDKMRKRGREIERER
jgi:hypothetical protein